MTEHGPAAAPLFQTKGIAFVTSGATHPMLPRRLGDNMFMTRFGELWDRSRVGQDLKDLSMYPRIAGGKDSSAGL